MNSYRTLFFSPLADSQAAPLLPTPVTTPPAPVTLAERAMLASLSLSFWRASKTDRKASKETCAHYGTDSSAAQVHKSLLPEDAKSYDAIKSAMAALGAEFRTQTLPWGEGVSGVRLLPAANYLPLSDAISKHRAIIEQQLIPAFLAEYPALYESSKIRLNGLWRAEDYPSPGQMAEKFAIRVSVQPFPTSADFRVSLSAEEGEAIRRQIDAESQASTAAAMRDVWGRLREHLGHMSATLGGTTVKGATKHQPAREVPAEYRDTLFTNLADLCDLLPRLNLLQNPLLDRLAGEARERILAPFSPEQCRKSPRRDRQPSEKSIGSCRSCRSHHHEGYAHFYAHHPPQLLGLRRHLATQGEPPTGSPTHPHEDQQCKKTNG